MKSVAQAGMDSIPEDGVDIEEGSFEPLYVAVRGVFNSRHEELGTLIANSAVYKPAQIPGFKLPGRAVFLNIVGAIADIPAVFLSPSIRL